MNAIGTYLLLMLQGNFFTCIVKTTEDHERLSFLPRKYACFSYPSYNSEFCNKATTNKSYLIKIRRILLALTLLHEKGAIS